MRKKTEDDQKGETVSTTDDQNKEDVSEPDPFLAIPWEQRALVGDQRKIRTFQVPRDMALDDDQVREIIQSFGQDRALWRLIFDSGEERFLAHHQDVWEFLQEQDPSLEGDEDTFHRFILEEEQRVRVEGRAVSLADEERRLQENELRSLLGGSLPSDNKKKKSTPFIFRNSTGDQRSWTPLDVLKPYSYEGHQDNGRLSPTLYVDIAGALGVQDDQKDEFIQRFRRQQTGVSRLPWDGRFVSIGSYEDYLLMLISLVELSGQFEGQDQGKEKQVVRSAQEALQIIADHANQRLQQKRLQQQFILQQRENVSRLVTSLDADENLDLEQEKSEAELWNQEFQNRIKKWQEDKTLRQALFLSQTPLWRDEEEPSFKRDSAVDFLDTEAYKEEKDAFKAYFEFEGWEEEDMQDFMMNKMKVVKGTDLKQSFYDEKTDTVYLRDEDLEVLRGYDVSSRSR